jgi:hypothetical protein
LTAVGSTFCGVFSANNTPDQSHFPNGVTYQRNANFTTKTLLNVDNKTTVTVSIDPFFFSIGSVPDFPHVHQLYYNPSTRSWIDQDVTALTGGSRAASSSGTSGFGSTDGPHAYYVGADGHVYHLYKNNNNWIDQDLTALTGGPVTQISAISSFASTDGLHVFYVTS